MAIRRSTWLARYLVLASVLLFCTQAYAIPVGQLIQNGGFNNVSGNPSLANWTTSGPAGNPPVARRSTDGINTRTSAAGFNNFFSSAFAVLGNSASNSISGAPDSGISTISQTFTLPPTQGGTSIFVYDLTISFMMAFDGDDAANYLSGSVFDVFTASLNNNTFFTQTSDPLTNCGTGGFGNCGNTQINQNPYSITLTGLRPGTYTLRFALNEAATTGIEGSQTNTAIGLDGISVTGEAFVPEPGTFVLLATGLVALGAVSMRRRGRKQA